MIVLEAFSSCDFHVEFACPHCLVVENCFSLDSIMGFQVIRLSAATQEYANSIICNVHGVNPKFLEIGNKKKEQQQNGTHAFAKGAYYIGKMVWSKGYKELLELLDDHQKELAGLEVDLYGNGEDFNQIQEAAEKLQIVVRVYPGRDHADPIFHE